MNRYIFECSFCGIDTILKNYKKYLGNKCPACNIGLIEISKIKKEKEK